MIGERIDKALSFITEIGSRSRAEWLIENKRVLLNNKLPKASAIIKETDILSVDFPEPQKSELIPLKLDLKILFEDEDIIVIDKPAGLVIHPAAGHAQDTLVNALLHHTSELSMKFGEQRPGIVHRLDKDTSGVLVIAKNDLSHEGLTAQFKKRTIHRIYYALVLGCPKSQKGTITSHLGRHPKDRKKFATQKNNDGKLAITHYEKVQTILDQVTLLKVKLETGRTHQIRVHLSEQGHPIVADQLYGANKKNHLIKNKKILEIVNQFPRFALHASELGFNHPRNGEKLFFSSNWPEDLKPLLENLGFKI
jgi:23S rRNA pseudouridine1911/1915/1917 synthase